MKPPIVGEKAVRARKRSHQRHSVDAVRDLPDDPRPGIGAVAGQYRSDDCAAERAELCDEPGRLTVALRVVFSHSDSRSPAECVKGVSADTRRQLSVVGRDAEDVVPEPADGIAARGEEGHAAGRHKARTSRSSAAVSAGGVTSTSAPRCSTTRRISARLLRSDPAKVQPRTSSTCLPATEIAAHSGRRPRPAAWRHGAR